MLSSWQTEWKEFTLDPDTPASGITSLTFSFHCLWLCPSWALVSHPLFSYSTYLPTDVAELNHICWIMFKVSVLFSTLWPTVSKDRFKLLVCLRLRAELHVCVSVCVCVSLPPEVIFLILCLQQPGTSAETVFDRGILCVLCGNIKHKRCSLHWNLQRKILPRVLPGWEPPLIYSNCKWTNKLFPFPKTLCRICTISQLARRRSFTKPWGKVLRGVVKCQKDFSVGKIKVMF